MDEAEEVYARLKNLLVNLPKDDVPSYIVEEYHNILDALHGLTGKNYDIYRIPSGKITPRVVGGNAVTGRTDYSEEIYCGYLFFITKAGGVPKPQSIPMKSLKSKKPGIMAMIQPKPQEPGEVERICKRFSQFVYELKDRPRMRPPWIVEDEYDVQYAMHAILRLFFDDVRPEEWTPSYAGAPAKMDFLLPEPKIVIETKMSREGMTAKTLSDELIVDIARYAKHRDCKTLVCFVYDPGGRIKNPAGVKGDLEKMSGQIQVRVFIER